jgi:hypothetical protein
MGGTSTAAYQQSSSRCRSRSSTTECRAHSMHVSSNSSTITTTIQVVCSWCSARGWPQGQASLQPQQLAFLSMRWFPVQKTYQPLPNTRFLPTAAAILQPLLAQQRRHLRPRGHVSQRGTTPAAAAGAAGSTATTAAAAARRPATAATIIRSSRRTTRWGVCLIGC